MIEAGVWCDAKIYVFIYHLTKVDLSVIGVN